MEVGPAALCLGASLASACPAGGAQPRCAEAGGCGQRVLRLVLWLLNYWLISNLTRFI